MLKKVSLTNTSTGRTVTTIVDTDSDEGALIGSGKAGNETAKINNIVGIDETIHRLTLPRQSMEDRVALFNGVARCLDRNIPTIKSFELQANRVKSPRYRGIIADISHHLSMGENVSDALSKHPDAFGPEITALVRGGEESGQLAVVFNQIANGQKKSLKIIKKLKTGMIYPAIVVVMAVAVVIVMSFTLVPAVSKLYGSFNADLPGATVMMMTISENLIAKPYLVLIPVIFFWLLFKYWGKIVAKPLMQKLMIKIPTVGNIVRKSAAAVSFRTLAMLLENNVRMNTALEIAADTAPHLYYRTFFTRIKEHVNYGLGLSESFLIESHWLGEDGRNICGIMEIAAETGSATEMLNEVANDYEDELDTIANQIDKILEPITIIFLGLMVGFLIYAIYSPIFNLGNVVLPGKDEGAEVSK